MLVLSEFFRAGLTADLVVRICGDFLWRSFCFMPKLKDGLWYEENEVIGVPNAVLEYFRVFGRAKR